MESVVALFGILWQRMGFNGAQYSGRASAWWKGLPKKVIKEEKV